MQQARFALLYAMVAIGLTVMVGCGPAYVPVEGTVTYDGEPLSDASVMFQPVGDGPNATGATDPRAVGKAVAAGVAGAVPDGAQFKRAFGVAG